MSFRVCAARLCPELVPDGRWCPAHKPKRPKEYRSPESKRHQRALKSQKWRRFSEQYRRENPWCVWCGAPAEAVDHLDGQGPDGPRGYDTSNTASTCWSCHSKKTAAMDGSFGRPRVERP